MEEKLDIYFSKVFCRMRHKTQLYNGAIFDHFHTRLQHSLEVEEIAIKIAKKLLSNGINCDIDKVSEIALLHDIGHTPFGHAGERTLHEILSGELNKGNLPDFKKLYLSIGFKHNINSTLLYIEEVGYQNVDETVLEGILKHTKLKYKENDVLDYGFSFVTNGFNISYDNIFKHIEGFIVAYADEIAQICSDYLDINLDFYENNGTGVTFNSKPYSLLENKAKECGYRKMAKMAADYLVDLFCDSFIATPSFGFVDATFLEIIKEFDKERSIFIKTNERINDYDKEKSMLVYELFSYYYNNPTEMTADFFADFIKRAKRKDYFTGSMRDFSDELKLDKNNIDESKIKISKMIEKILTTISSDDFDYHKIYSKDCLVFAKIYIRSIAIYISKMTDNYADRKYSKLKKSIDNE